ncbi:MAG: hypothetical protein ABIO41_11070 [Ignavibacteria bacterium]
MSIKSIFYFIIFFLFFNNTFSQTNNEERITDVEKPFKKYLSWTIAQMIPSITWLNDRNENNSSLNFALRWHITPLNISFTTNKYISPVQFFLVNPMRKYTGSLEFFVQPEWSMSRFENSGLKKFGVGVGSRINIPLKNYGEHLYTSLGGKYNFRKNDEPDAENKGGYYGIEAGIYAIFGLIGFQFNYNFDKNTKYNFGIYIKYW